MKRITVAVASVLLCISHVSAQTQPVVTGSDIPDAAAWRIWLNQKGEAPGNHSEAFTTYLVSLGLSPADAAALQAALESYAMQETALRTAINDKIDEADKNFDGATASNLQMAFQTKLAALVGATQAKLESHLSANGAAFLTKFIENEKKHMTISLLDTTLAQTRKMVHVEPAAYHVHGDPQGTQMGFSYSTYASTWISVTGTNSSGEPYGTFYEQIGAQGTTNPCWGQCLSAYHSAVTEYNHAGGGTQSYTVAHQPANNSMNAGYVYSWPFDATNNYFWGNELAWVYVQCTIAGIFLQNNPIVGSTPFQSEVATTFTTTPGQVPVTCTNHPTCVELFQRSAGTLPTYCSTLYPDYLPASILFYPAYNVTFLQFLQSAPCERTGTGEAWACQPSAGYNNPGYSEYSLNPPAGGAICTSHHP